MLPASISRALVPRAIISDAKSIVWGVGRGASQCCHTNTTLCEACEITHLFTISLPFITPVLTALGFSRRG